MDASYFRRVGIFAGFGIVAALLSTIGYILAFEHGSLYVNTITIKLGLSGMLGYVVLTAVSIAAGVRIMNKEYGRLTTCLRWLVHSLVILAVAASVTIIIYTFHWEGHRTLCYAAHFVNYALLVHMVICWAKSRINIVIIDG